MYQYQISFLSSRSGFVDAVVCCHNGNPLGQAAIGHNAKVEDLMYEEFLVHPDARDGIVVGFGNQQCGCVKDGFFYGWATSTFPAFLREQELIKIEAARKAAEHEKCRFDDEYADQYADCFGGQMSVRKAG